MNPSIHRSARVIFLAPARFAFSRAIGVDGHRGWQHLTVQVAVRPKRQPARTVRTGGVTLWPPGRWRAWAHRDLRALSSDRRRGLRAPIAAPHDTTTGRPTLGLLSTVLLAHTRSGVPGLLNSNNLTVQLAPWFLAAALRASSQSLRNCTIPLSVSGW